MVIGLNAELGRGMAMNDDFKFFNERLLYENETGFLFWKKTDLIASRIRGKKVGSNDGKGYLVFQVKKDGKKSMVKAHRVAWLLFYGAWPFDCIDHINGDRKDNRIGNLRNASFEGNSQNKRKAQENNKLGVLGVNIENGKFRAQIKIKGKKKTIGRYETIEEASKAYINAKRELHSFCTI